MLPLGYHDSRHGAGERPHGGRLFQRVERARPVIGHPQQPEPDRGLLPCTRTRQGLWPAVHDRLLWRHARRRVCDQHRWQDAVRHRGLALCLLLHRDDQHPYRRHGDAVRGGPPQGGGQPRAAHHHRLHVAGDQGNLPNPQLPDHHPAGHCQRHALVCIRLPHALVPAHGILGLACQPAGCHLWDVHRGGIVSRGPHRRHRQRDARRERPHHGGPDKHCERHPAQCGAAAPAAARPRRLRLLLHVHGPHGPDGADRQLARSCLHWPRLLRDCA
mmetsp:Transcript_2423/g.6096  ORF Transcript_2423/g.6096 Transcript_2423/m.6096 type:complete len:273 (+) Transcript_2423:444-1262(+)